MNNTINNTWKIYILTLIAFFLGTSQFVIVGILDKVADSVGVSVASAGQLITVFSLANAIGTPIVMVATTKIDQRKRLLTALCIMLLGIIMTFSFSSFNLLLIARAFLGVGNGVFVASAYSVAPKLVPAGREVRAMSNVALGFSAALVLGVPMGRVITVGCDWKVIFMGIGVFILIGIALIAQTIPAMESEKPVSLGDQFAILKNPRIAAALGMTLFTFIGYSVFNTYSTPFLTSAMKSNGGQVSVVLFALGIASLIGSKLGGFVADRIGVTSTLIGGMLIQIIALVLLFAFAPTTIISIPLLMIWATAVWTFVPPQNFNLVSIAPEASSIVLSLSNSFIQFGFAGGSYIGGVVVGTLSIKDISLIGAGSVAIAAIIAVMSLRFTYGKSSNMQAD